MDSRLLGAASLLLTATLCACTPRAPWEKADYSSLGLRQLELKPIELSTGDGGLHVLRTIAIPPDRGGWEVSGKSTLIEGLPGQSPDSHRVAIALLGPGEKAVKVMGPFEPDQFNQVNLLAMVRGEGTITLEAMGESRPVGVPVSVRASAWSSPQYIVFELPESFAPRGETVRALRFLVDGELGPMGIGELELHQVERNPVSVPPSSMPANTHGAVTIEGSTRRAWSLSTDHSLAGEFIPMSGEFLKFSARLDPSSLPATVAQEVALFLRIQSSGYLRIIERALPLTDTWQRYEVSLDDYVGRQCKVSFSVQIDGSGHAFALLESPGILQPKIEQPTVLLITSSAHRGDHLPFVAGAREVHSPALEDLMARGVTFENAYSSSDATLPAHNALFTGLHPRDTGVISNDHVMGGSVVTLAQEFQKMGWRTVASTSSAALSESGGAARGFDRFNAPVEGERSGDLTIDSLRDDLKDFIHEPLFVWLHLNEAQRPYEPPRRYVKDAAGKRPLATDYEPGSMELLRLLYRGEVNHVDALLKPFLSAGRMNTAIIAFTSDRGEDLDEPGLGGNRSSLGHAMLHVPLIITWPDAAPELQGLLISARAGTIDLGKTLLLLAGSEASTFPGDDLLRGSAGLIEQDPVERTTYAIAHDGQAASITRGNLHLILHLPQASGHELNASPGPHRVELHDLQARPGSEQDLQAEELQLTRQLRNELIAWLRTAPRVSADPESIMPPGQGKGLEHAQESLPPVAQPPEDSCDCSWCTQMKD